MFSNRYWRINKRMLKIIGLWPYQKTHVKVSIRTFILVAIHTMMIPQIIRTFEEWGKNSNIVVENVTGFFYFQAIIFKYLTNFIAEAKLQYLYETISTDWLEWDNQEEKEVLAKHAEHGRFLTIGYTAYLFTVSIVFTLLPALIPAFLDLVIPLNTTRQKTLCFYGEYFIDQQVYYYELLFHTFFCVMCTIILITTIDSTYSCCVQHVVGLFHLVEYRLNKAFELVRGNRVRKSIDLDEKVHDYVISAMKLHQKSVEFVNMLQTTYTTCFFITTVIFLVGLSCATVDLMMSINNYINLARVFFAWCGIVLYLFYVSMPGQKIIDSSFKIFNSVYFCGWYDFPLETQRLLRFFMLRCSKACVFTAGPFYIMNLENCGVVLKLAMSYCAFVRTLT